MEKLFIVSRLAAFETSAQIVKELKQYYNRHVAGTSAIDYYKYNEPWASLVKEEREKWLKDVKHDIPMSNAKVRMQKIEQIFDEAMTERLTRIYHYCGDIIGEVHEKELGTALQALENMRKEVKNLELQLEGKATNGQGKAHQKASQSFHTEHGDINFVTGDLVKQLEQLPTDRLEKIRNELYERSKNRFGSAASRPEDN